MVEQFTCKLCLKEQIRNKAKVPGKGICNSCYRKGEKQPNYFVTKNCSICMQIKTLKRKSWYSDNRCSSCYEKTKDAKERSKRYKHSSNHRYNELLCKCRNKKYECDLTREVYYELICQTCFYCNGRLGHCGIGLDRINNLKGYTFDNVVPCCGFCNHLKGAILTKDETIEIIKLLKKLRNIHLDEYTTW